MLDHAFAVADPVKELARRLARTSDPPSAIASLLGQAHLAIFEERLGPDQRRDATQGVTLAATRYDRTSTTLHLAAPVPARPHLVRFMRTAAERAFAEHVDVDGMVSYDGEVLMRLAWDKRHPVPARVLELVCPASGRSLWPAACLVTPLLLHAELSAVAWNSSISPRNSPGAGGQRSGIPTATSSDCTSDTIDASLRPLASALAAAAASRPNPRS